ncbi:MAG: hypothetical protein ACE5E9_14475, partial [Nitrospinaceae bacterium]
AQEVQHVFNLQGLNWHRDIANPLSPHVAAQEVGISEHFEADIAHFPNVNDPHTADYMYYFGTIDSLWNGAWGLVRTHPEPSSLANLSECFNQHLSDSEVNQQLAMYLQFYPPYLHDYITQLLTADRIALCNQAIADYGAENLPIARLPNNPLTVPFSGNNTDEDVLNALSHLPDGIGVTHTAGFNSTDICPSDAPVRNFEIEAWAAQDLLPGGRIEYNPREGIVDPSGLLFIHASDKAALQSGAKAPEPLVMRARAGDCIKVKLTNMLPENVPDHAGDAEFPNILSMKADMFRPSNQVSLHPALVATDVRYSDGLNTGYNTAVTGSQTVGPAGSGSSLTCITIPGWGEYCYEDPNAAPSNNNVKEYTWYAGLIDFETDPNNPLVKTMVHTPEAFGAVNLFSGGDVFKQVEQGLVGMLVVEPEDANFATAAGTSTDITFPPGSQNESFKEFVVIYQDGLNLLHDSSISGTINEILNCPICDDSYDRGDQGFNYRAEPFWARLGMDSVGCTGETGEPSACSTHDSVYPKDFFMNSFKSIETPVFHAEPGENVKFRVGHPGGLARQQAFIVNGHFYWDYGIVNFGSPGAALVAPGKSFTAEILGGAREGTWLFRSNNNFHWAGGMWGQLVVGTPPAAPTN